MKAQTLQKQAQKQKAPKAEPSGKRETHVASWKKEEVEGVVSLLKEYPIVGIASVSSLPAAQLGEIRKKIINDARIITTKKTLARIAMREAGRKELEELLEKVQGPFSLVLSKNNPFKVYALCDKNKSKTKARAGQVADDDIVVKAGDTQFTPGPVLSDLKAAGLDAIPIEGKIKIRKDSVVAKKGQVITPKAAEVLSKLDMKPMQVGLNIKAMWEHGTIYLPEVLRIDSVQVMNNFVNAYRNAINLSVNAGYPTRQNIEVMLAGAERRAFNLAFNAGILTKETTPLLLAKAAAQARALGSMVKATA